MFQYLFSIIDKNPTVQNLALIVMISMGLFSNFKTLEEVSNIKIAQYDYALQVFTYSISDISDVSQVVPLVEKWNQDHWGAQIAAINTLCRGDGKLALEDLVGNATTVDICRLTM